MGQAGSHGPAPHRGRRALALPHEPPKLAPKVLPPLCESPRLRSTDNGVILQSGGTISGRRPTIPQDRVPHGHMHANVYRTRANGITNDETRARERDPLHRSHTNLDIRHSDSSSSISKRFGSEPDLRIEEEHKAKTTQHSNRHFRKKYRAPPPPTHDNFEGSSPDSSEGNAKAEPQRKLRLFKTRNETKKLNGQEMLQFRSSHHEYRSLDLNDNQFERRYRSPCKDKEQHFKYPDDHDMVQSTTSLKREERLIQTRECRKTRIDRMSGCRAKTSKPEQISEAWKTPVFNRDFRHSERFRKDPELPPLRREKTFDETLITFERDSISSHTPQQSRTRIVGEQLKINKPLAESNKPLRKSLPSLLKKNSDEKDEFQAELKKATSKIRNQLGNKFKDSESKTSQDKTKELKIPTKIPTKVQKSSPSNVAKKPEPKAIPIGRPLNRANEKIRQTTVNSNLKILDYKLKNNNKENDRRLPDRGQASGKESTPEHSPTRKLDSITSQASPEKQKTQPPSKQFYFGMIESKQADSKKHLKDFPGLGSPIIEESNFHIIEQKLLSYEANHDEDAEFEKFNSKIKENKVKNISSESALSSEGSEGSWSAGSLGIALRLRPTMPKKQRTVPRFSPAAAWKQLASLDDHLAAETQPLAVETKMSANISAESSPRSDQSADKSGDSGISGDNGHSDHRIDSLRHRVSPPIAGPPAWTPQQDLGDSSSESAGIGLMLHSSHPAGNVATYSPVGQPFSLSLPRDGQERGKQIQQGFNSLQKLRKSVSGALGAALSSRRFDVEHEPMLLEQEQNWFLTKSAPNSLSNPLIYQQPRAKGSEDDVIKEEDSLAGDKSEPHSWRPGASYLSWGGHVMYLPPAPDQPLSMMPIIERPIRSKSSGCMEASARAARAAALGSEMRERERSASPSTTAGMARAMPVNVLPASGRSSSTNTNTNTGSRGKRFTFQSTVRQLERRRIADKLSKEADLKEQQRRTEVEAMRRVEEEFQRKRAREKASIRQQLRLVSSGATSMPSSTTHTKARDDPEGSCRESPAPERVRDRQRHSNASSEISGRSKSSTPIRAVELSEWHSAAARGARVYRDWPSASAGPAHAHDHPPACARMPIATHNMYNGAGEVSAFSGSPRSDNYRLEFARGRSSASPRTPRAPRLLHAARASSSSGSELSLRQPIKIRW